MSKHLLLLGGRLATAARRVVGGHSPFTFGHQAGATIDNLKQLCDELRAALDEYDDEAAKEKTTRSTKGRREP